MQSTSRLKYLDMSKGLGILLVMYGHITYLDNPVDTWMSSFKIVMFYIIAGYLLNHKDTIEKTGFKDFVLKLFRTLLIPYFLFSVLQIIYNAISNINDTDIIQQIVFDVYNAISFRGLLALWFLPSLFIAEILMYLVLKSPKPVKLLSLIIPVVTGFLLTALIVYLQEALNSDAIYKIISKPAHALIKGIIAFWFVFVGYYMFSVLKHIKSSKLKITLGISLFIINIFLSQLNRKIDFNMLKFGSTPVLFYVCGVIGSVSVTLIFEFLEKYINFRILIFCGKNSLVIFATHLLFGITENLVFWFDKFFPLPLTASVGYLFNCLVILAVLLIIEYLITMFINKKALFLIGKGQYTRQNNIVDIIRNR